MNQGYIITMLFSNLPIVQLFKNTQRVILFLAFISQGMVGMNKERYAVGNDSEVFMLDKVMEIELLKDTHKGSAHTESLFGKYFEIWRMHERNYVSIRALERTLGALREQLRIEHAPQDLFNAVCKAAEDAKLEANRLYVRPLSGTSRLCKSHCVGKKATRISQKRLNSFYQEQLNNLYEDNTDESLTEEDSEEFGLAPEVNQDDAITDSAS